MSVLLDGEVVSNEKEKVWSGKWDFAKDTKKQFMPYNYKVESHYITRIHNFVITLCTNTMM